ncbi:MULTISPECIES: DeoR/GlpR family DNA-binding transcription regulator [Subtercola]|uniref:DeoR/GlpR transcriptional regulator n=1 Tax=Subtercola vilae TaxID=2056433 RepID=A0A4T2BV44_9MICO|nr:MULTISPECIES: DeoR/GlpR family DNA-binding transcription regulator [Subtercola]MEA9985924.1 DeoR/GlpR family DNA-binding transcription regulator [Subtercola sp. RTI3]TIH35555.1 DeoR/GlpR transcriptional regulator [Subtercola vilae]
MSESLAFEKSAQTVRLPAGRKAEIAAFVTEVDQVTVAMLSARFGVSSDTIRRDLDHLDADGILVRTHGGAVSRSAMLVTEKKLDVRMQLHTSAKEKIGELAANLVDNASVIMINAGTTCLAVARHLGNHRELTIATNNLRVPAEVSPKAVNDLYLFGGAVRLAGQSTVGPVSFRVAGRDSDLELRCDLALISVGAVSADGGYSTSNVGEAVMMGEMISRASRVAILADSSKFGAPLFARIADLGSADYLVTDKEPPADIAAALQRHGVTVILPDGV